MYAGTVADQLAELRTARIDGSEMAGVPRSQIFIRFHFTAAGPSPIFTVPDGYTALVKSVYVNNNSTVEANLKVLLNDIPSSTQVVVLDETIATLQIASATLWVVVHPGMWIYAYASQVDVVVWVSGALLAGPPQFPPASREAPAQLPGPAWARLAKPQ